MTYFSKPWWIWRPDQASPWDYVYRSFNLFEASVWFIFAGLVAFRWGRHRQSPVELVYAAAFAAFGLTDVAEAWQQSAWLVAFKAVNLAALLALRAKVMRRWYPESRLY
jgi:hypothetical protein